MNENNPSVFQTWRLVREIQQVYGGGLFPPPLRPPLLLDPFRLALGGTAAAETAARAADGLGVGLAVE